MPSYNAPGVYIQDVTSGFQSITQASSSIGIMFGKTVSGLTNTAQKITSWAEYVEKYANGVATPFIANDYLSYAVYGFFQNGGQELYVDSIKKSGVKASGTSASSKLIATANFEGEWGNDISFEIKKNATWTATNKLFDVTVTYGTYDKATVTDLTFETIVDKLNANVKIASWVKFSLDESAEALAEETTTLTGGSDGSALGDTDYVNALEIIGTILDEITFVAIPGQTSSTVISGILAYCDTNGLFPIIDLPTGTTPAQAKTTRQGINAFTGCVCYPWGKITDPLTDTLKAVPTAGHVMGVYARVIESRGVFKAPAGVDAVVRGFVEMQTVLTQSDIATLNINGVCCIVARPNAGIVIWGARSLNSSDTTMRYVTDGLLNLNIKRSLYNGTQFAVFEPNDKGLWNAVKTSCISFLETLRAQGALKGSPEEAYYVTIDETNNTEATISAGQLNIEIGYAPVKPAEFIIIKLAHSIQS